MYTQKQYTEASERYMTLQIIELVSTGNRHQLVKHGVILTTIFSNYLQI
jgi:hypothetical protein